jgi:cysteine desulfurase/selenocysteine lyase
MSIPERGPGLPGEVSLVTLAPSDVERSGPVAPPSPGVTTAPARAPTAPTLPDADPTSLLLAMTRVANELFAPTPSTPLAPTSSSPPLPTTTPTTPTTPVAHGGPSSSTPRPFDEAPDFARLLLPGHEAHFHLPLFERPLLDPSSSLPSSSLPSPSLPSTSLPSFASPFETQPVVASPKAGASSTTFSPHALKAEFPILQQRVNGRPLIWLDNAATTQKPRVVIDRLTRFYETENSNIHRAAHTLAARATDAYERARETVRRFLNAGSANDVVFVRGTTEGINLVAQAWGRRHVEAGDEIILSHLEHHANIVPWQLLAAEKGAHIKVAPVDDRGQIRLDAYEALFSPRTKLVSFSAVSNALGTVTPAAAMIALARRRGVTVVLDGAQAVSHQRIDLQALRPDFFVFSGHKVFGPTGIGAVVASQALLDELPPWQGGGNMIVDVTFERTQFQRAPARFEAGTGNIADAVGLGTALEWVEQTGIEAIAAHEHALLVYGTERLGSIPGLRIIGTAAEKAGVLSFVVDGHDTRVLASALDEDGIAVRGGHHCAQPILRRFGLESTVRASLAPYNTFEDLDALAEAVRRRVGGR